MGPWAPMAFVFIVGFYGSMLLCQPQPLSFGHTHTGFLWWTADVMVFVWGVVVIVVGGLQLSLLAFLFSYTGWSWCLLTLRAGLCALAPLLAQHSEPLAAYAATLGSALRFPVLVAAIVTFTVWNTMLLPLLYFRIIPPGPKRDRFRKFNFGFFMSNVHVANLPMAIVNTFVGDGARLFTSSDLYAACLVLMFYSMLYLFVLDRLGLHFYPMFCPRSNTCGLAFGALITIYYCVLQRANSAMAG